MGDKADKLPLSPPRSPRKLRNLGERFGWHEGEPPPPRGIRWLFIGLTVTMILLNFDGGAIAAVLKDLERGCEHSQSEDSKFPHDERYPCLTEAEQGLLGALPYIGLCVGCPIVGRLLQTQSEKVIILTGIILDALATMVFAFVIEKNHLFMAKFLVGFSHSGISVYCPVWVDRFGPEDRRTLWLGLVQGTAAIGSMIGYGVTGYMTAWGIFYQNAFRLQAFGLAVCAVGLLFVPKSWIDISSSEDATLPSPGAASSTDPPHEPCVRKSSSDEHRDSSPSARNSFSIAPRGSRRLSWSAKIKELGRSRSSVNRRASGDVMSDVAAMSNCDSIQMWALSGFSHDPDAHHNQTIGEVLRSLSRNRIYRSTTMALCSLFFVVTGVQYWTSKYLLVAFTPDQFKVNTLFILVSGTAPIIGITSGGPIVDCLGGYATNQGAERTAALSAVWGFIAAGAGIVAAFTSPGHEEHKLRTVVGCIWILLLFGAAMLPPTTGLILSSVDSHQQVFANATSMLLYNLLGFGLGSYLPGQLAELCGNDAALRLRRAMQLIFLWSIFGLAFIADAYCACINRRKQLSAEAEPGDVQMTGLGDRAGRKALIPSSSNANDRHDISLGNA